MEKLKPSEVAQALDLFLELDIPCILWGSVGLGKSSLVAQAAKRHGMSLKVVMLAYFDPTDLKGFPYIEDGKSHWATPSFLPEWDDKCLIFWDEINRAATFNMNACTQAMLERRINEYQFGPGVRHIAACNPDGVGVNKMPEALDNRLAHLFVREDLDDWCLWAVDNGIHPLVIAFLRWKASLGESDSMFCAPSKKSKAFPTPRTWEQVSKLTYGIEKNNVPDNLAVHYYASEVGEGAALEYLGFQKLRNDLPDQNEILRNPNGARLSQEISAKYAVAGGLARIANLANFDAICTYLNRMDKEMMTMAVKSAIGRDPQLKQCQGYTKFYQQNSSIFATPILA